MTPLPEKTHPLHPSIRTATFNNKRILFLLNLYSYVDFQKNLFLQIGYVSAMILIPKYKRDTTTCAYSNRRIYSKSREK